MKKLVHLTLICALMLTTTSNARYLGAPAGAPGSQPTTTVVQPQLKTPQDFLNYIKTHNSPEEQKAIKAVLKEKNLEKSLKKKKEERADLSDPARLEARITKLDKEIASLETKVSTAHNEVAVLEKANPENVSSIRWAMNKALESPATTAIVTVGTAVALYGAWQLDPLGMIKAGLSKASNYIGGGGSSTPTAASGGGLLSNAKDFVKDLAIDYGKQSFITTVIGFSTYQFNKWWNNPTTTPAQKKTAKKELQNIVNDPNAPAEERAKAQEDLDIIEEQEQANQALDASEEVNLKFDPNEKY